jgi:hypothetical protein
MAAVTATPIHGRRRRAFVITRRDRIGSAARPGSSVEFPRITKVRSVRGHFPAAQNDAIPVAIVRHHAS